MSFKLPQPAGRRARLERAASRATVSHTWQGPWRTKSQAVSEGMLLHRTCGGRVVYSAVVDGRPRQDLCRGGYPPARQQLPGSHAWASWRRVAVCRNRGKGILTCGSPSSEAVSTIETDGERERRAAGQVARQIGRRLQSPARSNKPGEGGGGGDDQDQGGSSSSSLVGATSSGPGAGARAGSAATPETRRAPGSQFIDLAGQAGDDLDLLTE